MVSSVLWKTGCVSSSDVRETYSTIQSCAQGRFAEREQRAGTQHPDAVKLFLFLYLVEVDLKGLVGPGLREVSVPYCC